MNEMEEKDGDVITVHSPDISGTIAVGQPELSTKSVAPRRQTPMETPTVASSTDNRQIPDSDEEEVSSTDNRQIPDSDEEEVSPISTRATDEAAMFNACTDAIPDSDGIDGSSSLLTPSPTQQTSCSPVQPNTTAIQGNYEVGKAASDQAMDIFSSVSSVQSPTCPQDEAPPDALLAGHDDPDEKQIVIDSEEMPSSKSASHQNELEDIIERSQIQQDGHLPPHIPESNSTYAPSDKKIVDQGVWPTGVADPAFNNYPKRPAIQRRSKRERPTSTPLRPASKVDSQESSLSDGPSPAYIAHLQNQPPFPYGGSNDPAARDYNEFLYGPRKRFKGSQVHAADVTSRVINDPVSENASRSERSQAPEPEITKSVSAIKTTISDNNNAEKDDAPAHEEDSGDDSLFGQYDILAAADGGENPSPPYNQGNHMIDISAGTNQSDVMAETREVPQSKPQERVEESIGPESCEARDETHNAEDNSSDKDPELTEVEDHANTPDSAQGAIVRSPSIASQGTSAATESRTRPCLLPSASSPNISATNYNAVHEGHTDRVGVSSVLAATRVEADATSSVVYAETEDPRLTQAQIRTANLATTLSTLQTDRAALIASFAQVPAIATALQYRAGGFMGATAEAPPFDEEAVLTEAKVVVKRHIKLLHDYNEIKDIAQGLMGIVAESRGERMRDVQEEFGLGADD